jgi:hypothetical protein
VQGNAILIFSNGGFRSFRFFHYVGIADVDQSNVHGYDRIPGSSKLHSIFASDPTDPTKLLIQKLSCFCGPCLEEDFPHCENNAYVKTWKVEKIRPRSLDFARAHLYAREGGDPWNYEYNGDSMANLVQPGDNFAIPAASDNDEGVAFYTL